MLLVRHAEPDASVRDCVYGSLDVPLSAAGRAHAATLAEILRVEAPVAAYTSPLSRARETAAALGLDPVPHDGLRELDFGELEGLPITEAIERFPREAGWMLAPSDASFPGGESVAAVRTRALGAMRELVARHPGETIAVFSHSVPIRVVVADALGLTLDSLFRFEIAYGGISVVEWHEGTPFVRVVNAASL